MNHRGVSYTFGPDKVSEFLDLDLICRAHQLLLVLTAQYTFYIQVVEDGPTTSNYIFSSQFGAMMSVDETLMCSLKPVKFNWGSTTTAKPRNSPARVKVI
ncbi:hypothetical protein GQ457_06G018650 [Hibiscus cannabinus]